MTRMHPLSPSKLVRFVGGALAATAAVVTLAPMTSPRSAIALHDSPTAVLDQAWQIVNRDYVDETFNQVDWDAVRQDLLSRDYSSPEEAYTALVDALSLLEDPYTRFMTPEEFETLTNQTSGELSGVGIRLQEDAATNSIVVVEPLMNSPAMAAGIRSGDRILAINGESTTGMSVQAASERIRGEIGTQVILRVEREAVGAFEISLNRMRIEVPAVHYTLREEGANRVGYIRLTEFSSHAPQQMRRAIQALLDEGVNGFVLDLRNNPGGLLHASIDISRMWLNDGVIVQTSDRRGRSQDYVANQSALTDLPLAVLVNGSSASSSEILTGALLDNNRAIVIGRQTFGKALVQSVHPLSDGSGLAVTVAHYYTPNGTDISRRGILPTVEVRMNPQQQAALAEQPNLLGTGADPFYAQALESLQPGMLAYRMRSTQLGQRESGVPAD
jgi:carboxyl-terminal processing protease